MTRIAPVIRPTTLLASYRIGRLLGTGASARVYECQHSALGRRAAIKVLHAHLATNRVSVSRFLREGRTLSRVAHRNIVDVFDVGEAEGTLFLVMALVDGEDLRERIRRLGPMSVIETARCMLPVVSAVEAIHRAGVVHRDLKPNNIRIERDHRGEEVPKVLDFGVSKCAVDESGSELTGAAAVIGTTAYMAPEQLRSARNVDARSDVYALGVILYECVTGRRPFEGETPYELMHAILTEPVVPPSARCPSIPPAFDAVVLRAIERDPSRRFASAAELGQTLASFSVDAAIWMAEFSQPASEPPCGKEAGPESDPSLTLVSTPQRSARRPRSYLRMGVGGLAFGVALWACFASATGRSARRSSPASISKAPTSVVAEALSTPVVSSLHAEPIGLPSPTSVPPASLGIPMAPTAHSAEHHDGRPRSSQRVASPPLPPSTASPHEETGTNDVPILE